MQFSTTVEYALRAAVCLASHEGQPRTTAQIAQVTQMPASYLSKVLQLLVRSGTVRSQRGVGGGFSLTKPGSELTVLDIVEAVEPLQRIRSCPLGIQEHGVMLCPLHRKLDEALESIEECFSATRLSDLVASDNPIHPLCPPAVPSEPTEPK
jgi:Rrf2 family protein